MRKNLISMSLRSRVVTIILVAIYAVVIVCTNGMYTILDDEGTIVVFAGHPVMATVKVFVSGVGQHEHPPLSDILLHLWLCATNYSFFALRVFANVFYAAGILFASLSAERIAGPKGYWTTLVLGFVWPFAFQYGRITGWYCLCMFLVSLLTWLYLGLVEGGGYWSWAAFAIASILLVWSNYFGVAILLLLFIDLILFHREVATEKAKALLVSAAAIALSFVPLVGIALGNVAEHTTKTMSTPEAAWKWVMATSGYSFFSIFGSVAVAPWYLPLSAPVLAAMIALFVALWLSPGRRWFVYFLLAMVLLTLSGHMSVKKVLFLLPWLFIAMGAATVSGASRCPKMALGAMAAMVLAGWAGILSGEHYAAANLREPWGRVAKVVAGDARSGATIISGNSSFLFYLDYQLGLQAETGAAQGTNLGEGLYRSHGYNIPEVDKWGELAERPDGKVVVVIGPAPRREFLEADALAGRLRQRCDIIGEYKAAPDPAVATKQAVFGPSYFDALTYRTGVTWFDCSKGRR